MPLKIFVSCSLGGGGRYFSVPGEIPFCQKPTLTGGTMLHEGTPIARYERRVSEDQPLCFGDRHDHQRTLAIRIAAMTLASDSVTTTRFRPSKVATGRSLGQAQKIGVSTKCPKNVEKLSEKCPKIVRKGAEKHNFRTFLGHFLPIWSMLLFGTLSNARPLQI